MNASNLATLAAQLDGCRVIELSHPLEPGIPVSPNQPGFKLTLARRHGDRVRADGGSAANEFIFMGGHSGTHVDALCHVSHEGRLFQGVDAEASQRGGRFRDFGVETIPPSFCRGVMLDIPALRGADRLVGGERITAADLDAACEAQAVSVQPGDVVLIRSGWAHCWNDSVAFLGLQTGVPGPDESAATWLTEHGVRMAGAETTAFEHIPPGRGHALLPVHRMLLVEAGIPIIEMMWLDDLASAGISEFLFIMTPLRVVGATGIPVRPLALVAKDAGP